MYTFGVCVRKTWLRSRLRTDLRNFLRSKRRRDAAHSRSTVDAAVFSLHSGLQESVYTTHHRGMRHRNPRNKYGEKYLFTSVSPVLLSSGERSPYRSAAHNATAYYQFPLFLQSRRKVVCMRVTVARPVNVYARIEGDREVHIGTDVHAAHADVKATGSVESERRSIYEARRRDTPLDRESTCTSERLKVVYCTNTRRERGRKRERENRVFILLLGHKANVRKAI